MNRLSNQTWGDVQLGDVLIDWRGGRRTVTSIDRAVSRGYLVIGTDTEVQHSRTTGGHRQGGELVIERA